MRLRNLLMLLIVGMPGQALALEMEYHTYNGFLPIKTAFETIALIFSDGNYVTLFAVACALGAIAAVASAVVQIAKLGKANPMSVVWPLLIGAVLYAGFIVPKGDLHIYDNTLNPVPESFRDTEWHRSDRWIFKPGRICNYRNRIDGRYS